MSRWLPAHSPDPLVLSSAGFAEESTSLGVIRAGGEGTARTSSRARLAPAWPAPVPFLVLGKAPAGGGLPQADASRRGGYSRC
ncbi:MAG TPA: hypothetical protein VF026_11815 [Ktedonobacteraceae bacterium]